MKNKKSCGTHHGINHGDDYVPLQPTIFLNQDKLFVNKGLLAS